ncbi:MAG: TonB-dependent receptor [Verrucomicrobia bacterium]|nr:MAG: TonB-dependent receptor [Verrucomicrobiota bacterium]
MINQFELKVNKKAFEINMAKPIYGTFAEIGAGQEVARRFFHVGGAAGTVAKTISAYDMTFSDAIYGKSTRFVSRQRLGEMLDHEYALLMERLDEKCGTERTFFAFADTVAARSYKTLNESHGWMGIRFQSSPRGQPNEIILHVRMLDPHNLEQQEALGIVGVNLIYGAFFLRKDLKAFIGSLLDDLDSTRIEIDVIRFSGPDFAMVDNRIMCLELVTQGLAQAVLFRADGEVMQAADAFYHKPLLVERGSFRPVTNVAYDMMECAHSMFLMEDDLQGEKPEILLEITMKNLMSSGGIDLQDFLDRIDMLGAMGRNVMISNYGEFYRLIQYLSRYTNRPIGLPLGIPSLHEIFDEKYYINLDGGILEGLGRLFKKGVRLYVYPTKDENGHILEAASYQVQTELRALYAYLLENRFIIPMAGCKLDFLGLSSLQVLEKLQKGDPEWEKMVPSEVCEIIKSRKFFGWRP